MEGLVRTLQSFGIGRLAAILGGAAGVAAVLAAIFMHLGTPSMSLLYSNLDPKEASQVAAALDTSGIKHEEKGDGTTIMVDRDKVATARLLVAGKGLVTSGSVGYEIFDNAPALGQTDFVQNLNMKRATEGELGRTIRSINGVSAARVQLNIPKKQLFEQDAETPSAAVMLETGARRMSPDQVRGIRNMVAASVPGLKPERVVVSDQTGDLLAGLDDASSTAGGEVARNETEERIKKQVKDLVEGVVGPGKARITVHADVDTSHVSTQEEKYDADDVVARSTRTSTNATKEAKPGSSGAVTASNNVPNTQSTPGAALDNANTANTNDEVTNNEIGKTVTTTVSDGGALKKLSVSVAVDGVTAPTVKGKPGAYTPRTADEMAKLEALVRSAVGLPTDGPTGAVKVVNVRFQQPDAPEGGGTSGMPLALDKNDIIRLGELGVMLVVAALLIFFVLRPMMRTAGAPTASVGLASSGGFALAAPGGGGGAIGGDGAQALLTGPAEPDGMDLARIRGQQKVSSAKKVADFVDKHPDESVSIIRNWLHEG